MPPDNRKNSNAATAIWQGAKKWGDIDQAVNQNLPASDASAR